MDATNNSRYSPDIAARTADQEARSVPIPLSRTDAARQLRHLARMQSLFDGVGLAEYHTYKTAFINSTHTWNSALHLDYLDMKLRFLVAFGFIKAYCAFFFFFLSDRQCSMRRLRDRRNH